MKIRANPLSLGGIILFGIMLVLGVLLWFTVSAPDRTPLQIGLFTFFFLLVLGYCLDAASESLTLDKGYVTFDTWMRPKKRVNACEMSDVLVVYEGLNQERGIVSVRFRARDGALTKISLGPLWRRRDLEAFFRHVEEDTGECKLVEEVR